MAISGYNVSPPSNDASEVASNQLDWALQHKAKLGDPLKNLAEGINTSTANAFARRFGTTFETKSTNYNIAAPGDQGKLFLATGTITINLPVAADAGDGFPVAIYNDGAGIVTVDGDGTETINGDLTIALGPGASLIITCDSSNWGGVSSVIVQTDNPKVKTATQSKNTDVTLQNDDHLTGWTLVGSKLYSLEGWLDCTQNVGNLAYKFGFSDFPIRSSLQVYAQDQTGTIFEDYLIDIHLSKNITTMTDTERFFVKFKGSFQAHANGGTFSFQWAQETSSANVTSLFLSSWMHLRLLN